MKKNILIILLGFFAVLTVFSQSQVYQTYEEYQKRKGGTIHGIDKFANAGDGAKLVYKTYGKVYKLDCKDFWGFMYRGKLFRNDRKTGVPYRVMNETDGLVYYENGIAHVEMLKEGKTTGSFKKGYYGFFSKSLSSEMVAIPRFEEPEVDKKYAQFKEENPDHKRLWECVKEEKHLGKIRDCQEIYFKEVESDFR